MSFPTRIPKISVEIQPFPKLTTIRLAVRQWPVRKRSLSTVSEAPPLKSSAVEFSMQ